MMWLERGGAAVTTLRGRILLDACTYICVQLAHEAGEVVMPANQVTRTHNVKG